MGTIRQEQTDITNKNYIINGNFDVWQRGTSFSTTATKTFAPDRFAFNRVTAVYTVSQDTSVPTVTQSGMLSSYSLKCEVTTADGSVGAADFVYVGYTLEGIDFVELAQRTFTISFWVKSSLTGTYCIAFRNGGGDRSYVSNYTINSADTWEKKIITVTASPSAGTWTYTPGTTGLIITWGLQVGSNFQTTAGAWNTGNFLGTSSQVNNAATNGNTFFLSQVKLERGSITTPFVGRLAEQEIALCKRYYEKSYALATDPATNTAVNLSTATLAQIAATTVIGYVKFEVEKARTSGTGNGVSLFATDGTANKWDFTDVTGSTTQRSATIPANDTHGFTVQQTAALEYLGQGHYVAVAEF